MNHQDAVLAHFPGAQIVTRESGERTQHRIEWNGRFLSAWCGSEDRAWRAAHQREAERACRKDPW